jgi:PKD domain
VSGTHQPVRPHLLVVIIVAVALMAACGGGGGSQPTPQPPASPGIPATTTLSAETGNNTSAATSFMQKMSGSASAANVSKLPIRSLLYPGSTTKIYAHLVAWFGKSSHIDVGYQSDDPAEVHQQVEDMISRGIQGAIIDWYGSSSTTVNNATMLIQHEAEAHAGQFEFAVMEDGGALFDSAVSNHCDVTDQLLTDLNYIATQFETSSAYSHINGRPVVFFFGVDTYYIDWNRVVANAPNHPLLLFRGTGGLQGNIADGGFQWVDLNLKDPFDTELAAQDQFYSAAVANPDRVSFGSAYKGFNDTLAAWSTDRFIHPSCGQTWQATFSEISKFYAADHQLLALQLVTWNDYEEGTAIEAGIDNCVYLTPSISGNTLNWSVAGGSESTVDHYTIFISSDGQDLAKLSDVAAGTHFFDLSQVSLSSGTYTVYVKAVGLPSVQNKMSPAVAFHPGDQPPSAALAVTPTGSLAVSASTDGSSDADGSVANSTIDFGDGTVENGPHASHTYVVTGTYNITASVFDNAGASSVAVKQISVKPTAPGVTIFSPANGSTVNWPTSFVASANSSSAVTAMKVIVDGQTLYTINNDTINTPLKIFRGTHHIVVQASDSTGATISSAIDLTAEPGDQNPVAQLEVLPLPDISANTVLACTANSTDPDGFLISHKVQFSDGAIANVTGALHSFASPGTQSATATVTDQFGATDSASQTFAISGAAAPTVPAKIQGWPAAPKVSEPLRRP